MLVSLGIQIIQEDLGYLAWPKNCSPKAQGDDCNYCIDREVIGSLCTDVFFIITLDILS